MIVDNDLRILRDRSYQFFYLTSFAKSSDNYRILYRLWAILVGCDLCKDSLQIISLCLAGVEGLL